MYDILIKNGVIIDGTGKTKFLADVGIKDDKIVKVGELHDEYGEIEINASGKYVCPGFIDVNNHSDTYWQIFLNPNLESLIYQGITTIVGGNCGSSLAPLAKARAIETIQKWANINKISVNWLDLGEFFDFFEKRKIAVNFATLVGHGTIRRGILDDQMRNPNSKEMAFIERMLKNALDDGALGMSSGLIYTHARLAEREELIRLAKILKKYGAIYVTHMREESKGLLDSIEETIEVAKESKVKIHISHLKAIGRKNWHLMDEVLFHINQAKEEGLDITFDVFPYVNIGSVLYTLLPHWATDGGRKMMLNRIRDSQIKAKIILDMKKSDFDFKKIEISISSLDKTLSRRKITEIAQSQGKEVEEALLDILVASEGRVVISADVLSEKNIEDLLRHPLSIISTNGVGYNLEHARTGEMIHPRCFGSFSKVFRKYVLEKKILSWEEAVRKMTDLPAQKFGIKKRGKIENNYFADLIVIDPKNISDLSTSENPYQYSRGVDYMIVNGQILINEGQYTGLRNGEIIKL